MSNSHIAFHLRDMVTWGNNFPSGMTNTIKERYGEGPFMVVAVRLQNDETMTRNPEFHPEIVTIKLTSGEQADFSGGWFKKVS